MPLTVESAVDCVHTIESLRSSRMHTPIVNCSRRLTSRCGFASKGCSSMDSKKKGEREREGDMRLQCRDQASAEIHTVRGAAILRRRNSCNLSTKAEREKERSGLRKQLVILLRCLTGSTSMINGSVQLLSSLSRGGQNRGPCKATVRVGKMLF